MLGTGKYVPLSHVVLVPSPFQVEISIAKLKKCKSPGISQILAELVQARGEALHSKIHKVIKCI
jgi:hypothetical protein